MRTGWRADCCTLLAIAASALMLLAGCDEQGGATEAGENGETSPEATSPVTQEVTGLVPLEGDRGRLDDPASDGWDTEVTSARIQERLQALGKKIGTGDLGENAVKAYLADEFSSTDLIPDPARLGSVYRQAGIEVMRGDTTDLAPEHSGAAGFSTALARLREQLAGAAGQDLRVKFKVVGIERDGLEVVTRQLFEAARLGAPPLAEIHGEWIIRWKVDEQGEMPRMKEVRLARFELATGERRLFSDCTEAVLRGCESYEGQVLRGMTHWLHRLQDTRQMALLGTPGVALGDVNGDELDDLYLCQPGGLPNRLFLQQPDGTVRDATEESGTGWVESSRSALLVDLDNDGDQDLAVTTYARLVLAENDGTGRFEVAAIEETGIGAMGISAADPDGDGDLDLYVCHYSAGDVRVQAGATVIGSSGRFVYHDANNGGRNYFFENRIDDDGWTFAEGAETVGLDVNNRRFSLAAAWEDFDNDGDPDLCVANDFGRNNLYRNDGGRFTDIAAEVQAEDQASGMSVSWGDADRDGRMDLYVANMFSAAGNRIARQERFSPASTREVRRALVRFARGNTLLLQREDGFRDASEDLGVTMGRWAWSSMFADINNDGWEDLLVANGYITTSDPEDL